MFTFVRFLLTTMPPLLPVMKCLQIPNEVPRSCCLQSFLRLASWISPASMWLLQAHPANQKPEATSKMWVPAGSPCKRAGFSGILQAGIVRNIFFFPEMFVINLDTGVRKCPTIPTPEVDKNSCNCNYAENNLENTKPQKRYDHKRDASHKCPAVTRPLGNKNIFRKCCVDVTVFVLCDETKGEETAKV